ncbi:hypothetical protein CSAL01_05281 [Colletotrichum salicis]|uniref:Protein kinase n=1 Tax=Colletotrichum salicis TaxID=1209931 RepID=A0A135V1R2_9PEZI|nr:hypothetical protein CSAL01_05281 [Colletotrichum salicis]
MAWPNFNSTLSTPAHRALLQVPAVAVVNIISLLISRLRATANIVIAHGSFSVLAFLHISDPVTVASAALSLPFSPSPNVPYSVTAGHPSKSRPNQSHSHLVQVSSALVEADRPVSPILSILRTLSIQATPANLEVLVAKAKAYLLDPLTAPEPSQETGPGSSFINPDPLLRTFSQKKKGKEPVQNSDKSQTSHRAHSRTSSYPTPPASASPTRSSFHSSNPFSPTYKHASLSLYGGPASPASPSSPNHPLGRSTSVRSNGLRSPSSPSNRFPPSTSVTRSISARTRSIVEENAIQPSSSVQRSKSVNSHQGPSGLRRSSSINQRFPGDMSHRPLDMIKREQRAADRAPHLRTRKYGPVTDTIDSLDSIGGVYHHGGPYDATLASRNRNKRYAPVEAVKESNMEALKATPREYIQDSLEKHVPLQGTGLIPAGGTDMSGNVMNYEEGADLMREPNNQGGAYKRWDGIQYHPDDLKGKGEPSYTYERDLKEKKRMRKASLGNSPAEYEMRSGVNAQSRKDNGAMVRQRSVSNAADGRPGPSELPKGQSNSANVHRHNFGDSLKRRFGSIRRKNHAAA